jgi:hypothetical protein
MSAIPTIAEVLSEQLGRSPLQMESMIREALAEVNRRRWRKLSPEERAHLQEELERARSVHEQPFPPEDIAQIPLPLLPFFIRRVGEDLATARHVWRDAYDRYLELERSCALMFHEKGRLQITVAEKKAGLDPRVQEASKLSRELHERVHALERAETNLLQELQVRVELVRLGVLPDPVAVRPL